MTQSDKLPNQQQHPRQHSQSQSQPQPYQSPPSYPPTHPQQQQGDDSDPPPRYISPVHYMPFPAERYQQHQQNKQNSHRTPSTHRQQSNDSYPPYSRFPHRDPPQLESDSENVHCLPIGSVYSPQGHPHEQPHHDQQWRQQQQQQQQQQHSSYPYTDPSPTRYSRTPQSTSISSPYQDQDQAIVSRGSNQEHGSQPYSYFPSHSQQYSPDQQRPSPQARAIPQHMLESSLWDRHGSAASYRQEQPIESPQEAYTHQSRTASDRHYVLESVGPPASFSQRRLSISHSAGCSSLESTNLVQALPSVASASRISPQSASPPMMMHRPPTHGGEHTFILDHSMVRDNGLKPPMRNLPPIPPIRTKWSKGSSRDCPPLSLQSNSSYSTSRSGDSKMSPSTPRSSLIPSTSTLGDSYLGYDMPKQAYNVLIDHPSHMGNFVSESPVDFRRPFRDDHDMEHCSEQDDVREREDDDEDDDEDEDENLRTRKVARHHLANDNKIKAVTGSTSRQINDEEEEDTEEGNSTYASSSGSRKPSLANSPLRDMTKAPKKSARGKPTQAALDEAIAEYDEETGAQSLNGKGLGFYAPLVCARLAARGVTTYNDLVNDLAGSQPVERIEGGSTQERNGQGNIRRRVYDALNILQSLGIISMDKKAIEWIGIENSIPIGDLSRKIHPSGSNSFQHQERDGADESEEPEDDEMDIGIEQLQKDVESMRLRNELEMARLQDQIARGVRLNNLVERNKHKEEKELERQARRQKKKLDRKEEKRAQAAAGESMELGEESGDVGGEQKKRSEKRHHRHHRHRSPRAENEDQEEDDTDQNGDKLGEDVDEETARRIRKQERKEKRERKERRAQKRQEKEARKHEERIQMPFVVVRIPGYGGQSSDSEASISVVRRVREEPRSRKSGKSKKHADETTMVEIKMPHNEELNIISDTEIVGDLGLNDVPLSDLRAMLPQDVIDRAGYATTTTSGAHGDNIIASVQGGFERALVCSVGN